jgi:hypothetical protein
MNEFPINRAVKCQPWNKSLKQRNAEIRVASGQHIKADPDWMASIRMAAQTGFDYMLRAIALDVITNPISI